LGTEWVSLSELAVLLLLAALPGVLVKASTRLARRRATAPVTRSRT
jgi:hypothetical protein